MEVNSAGLSAVKTVGRMALNLVESKVASMDANWVYNSVVQKAAL